MATTRARRLEPPEQLVAAALLLGLYVATGLWLRLKVGYAIGDAIARSADAVYVISSRDPHLAAIGFYWPPLSSFVQLPFVPFLAPLGHADLAGPLSTAVCMSITCLLLMRMASSFGLGRRLSLLVGLLFGLNPVVVFYAANGMSEASCFLCLTVGMWGFIRYTRSHRPTDLAWMATGLAFGAMARVEVILVAVVVAGVATFGLRGLPRTLPRSLARGVVAALPPIYLFFLWMGVQWVLLGDPLFFVHTAAKLNTESHLDLRNGAAASAYLLPQAKDKLAIAGWLMEQVWFFGPTLFLAAVYAVTRPRTARVAVGLLAAAGTFAAVQVPYRLNGTAFNDPRYFTPFVVLAAVAAIWLLAELIPRPDTTHADASVRRRWSGVLRTGAAGIVLGSLVLGAVAGTVAEANKRRALVVQEDTFFARVLGRSRPYVYVQEWQTWRRVSAAVDHLLSAPGGPHRVICGTASCNPAVAFSTRPAQFVVESDRDYQSILSDPTGRFDLAITSGAGDPIASLLSSGPWKVAATFRLTGLSNGQVVEVWKYVGGAPTNGGVTPG